MEATVGLEIAAAELGVETRFAAFVEAHRDRALRVAWRLLGGDGAAAEDVVQDAFVRAWLALGRFRGDASLATWLYRILLRQAANHRRWRRLRERWGGLGTPDAAHPEPPATGDPALRQRIARALDALSRAQRECFVMVHLEGFTIAECAEVLGKAEGTVKSHLHRALASLRRELGDLADEREGARR